MLFILLAILAAEFPTPWVAGGASVVMFSALVAALIRLNTLGNRSFEVLRDTQGGELTRLNLRTEELQEENNECERRLNILIWTLQVNKIEVPPEIFKKPRGRSTDNSG